MLDINDSAPHDIHKKDDDIHLQSAIEPRFSGLYMATFGCQEIENACTMKKFS